MPANDRQRLAVAPVVKHWWTRTRGLSRIGKRRGQTRKLESQVSRDLKSCSKYSGRLYEGIASDITRLKENIVHLERDTVGSTEGIVRPEDNLVHGEGVIGCDEEDPEQDFVHDEGVIRGNNRDLVQPEEDTADPEGDILMKDISVFHAGASGDFEPRTVLLDSCAPVNIISAGALKGIRCDPKSGNFGVIRGLGSFIFPIKGTVRLRFRFWDRDEIFEEEFRVLPQLKILGHQFGPGFDCLLCWNWMRTHRRVWESLLEDAE